MAEVKLFRKGSPEGQAAIANEIKARLEDGYVSSDSTDEEEERVFQAALGRVEETQLWKLCAPPRHLIPEPPIQRLPKKLELSQPPPIPRTSLRMFPEELRQCQGLGGPPYWWDRFPEEVQIRIFAHFVSHDVTFEQVHMVYRTDAWFRYNLQMCDLFECEYGW